MFSAKTGFHALVQAETYYVIGDMG